MYVTCICVRVNVYLKMYCGCGYGYLCVNFGVPDIHVAVIIHVFCKFAFWLYTYLSPPRATRRTGGRQPTHGVPDVLSQYRDRRVPRCGMPDEGFQGCLRSPPAAPLESGGTRTSHIMAAQRLARSPSTSPSLRLSHTLSPPSPYKSVWQTPLNMESTKSPIPRVFTPRRFSPHAAFRSTPHFTPRHFSSPSGGLLTWWFAWG